jgi:hypothetical protein
MIIVGSTYSGITAYRRRKDQLLREDREVPEDEIIPEDTHLGFMGVTPTSAAAGFSLSDVELPARIEEPSEPEDELDELAPEVFAYGGDDMWEAMPDEVVDEIKASDWSAPADQEIMELPPTTRVQSMSFYPRDQIDDSGTGLALPWDQAPAPEIGRPPEFLKDDDVIEAPVMRSGDYDHFSALRNLAGRLGGSPRSPGQRGGRGPPGSPDMWDVDAATRVPALTDIWYVPPDGGDEFGVGGGDIVDPIHSSQNPFEAYQPLESGQGALEGYGQDLEVPIMDDDNYIVLEL